MVTVDLIITNVRLTFLKQNIHVTVKASGLKCRSWSSSYSSVCMFSLPSSCNDRATFLRRISWGTVADVTSSDSVTVCGFAKNIMRLCY